MKKLSVALLLIGWLAGTATAQIGLRNISSISVDVFLNDADSAAANGGPVEKLNIDLNQVILFRVAPWLSAELKIQRQDEQPFASPADQGWHETTISVAPIFVLSGHIYVITRYGLGIGTGYERPASDLLTSADVRGLSHDLTVDANYETAQFLANLTVRGSLYPDLDYWFLVPSAGLRYNFPSGYGVSGKYFFSYNSFAATSHAILSEFEFPLSESISAKVGGSASVTPTNPLTTRWQYTGIAGISFRITETLGLKYHAEYLGRQNAGPGVRNLLVLDARF